MLFELTPGNFLVLSKVLLCGQAALSQALLSSVAEGSLLELVVHTVLSKVFSESEGSFRGRNMWMGRYPCIGQVFSHSWLRLGGLQ